MKKFLSLLGLVCFVGLASLENANAKTLYLNTGGSSFWGADGINCFFSHAWGDGSDADQLLEFVTGNIYKVEVADSKTSVIFVRMPNGSTTLDWSKKYNQTGDLTIASDKNCFTITGWGQGEGANSEGTWSQIEDPEPTPVTYHIAGNGVVGNPWCCGLDWQAAGCDLGEDNSITFTGVPAGSYAFKITNGTWTQSWGGAYVDAAASTAGYVVDKDGNAAFKIEDAADITVSFDGKKIVLTSTKPFVPTYVSSVPSQCTDVLMQGFYWNSYDVDSANLGTDKYGDTRWKTLLKKSGEIGAYFDMIWLPPSAYASGTGYHPKQYSNQSSDWGSRAELQTLIKAFHNVGTKVVADVVVNHMDAMGAWCDLSTQNFGKYGVFVPNNSWISCDDEMNDPANTADTLAGDCWGLATGAHEDGYCGESNYGAARDWAHNNQNDSVRMMCRAYLKWLKNEIGYDGWRFDYCKGLHASHLDDYTSASEGYIAFMEFWSGNSEIQQAIQDAKMNVMALDFQSKYQLFDHIGKSGNFVGRGGGLMADDYWKKYAVTWIDSHDNFLRGNGGEFGGVDGKSMTPEMKPRLMQANALMLSMPGVPCVFYPHWYQYTDEINAMINARHCAGVHSESVVSNEQYDNNGSINTGYEATIEGKNGFIVLKLGTKDSKTPWSTDVKLMASGEGYSVWVKANDPVAPRLIVTPDATFEDSIHGISVSVKAVGGTSDSPMVYYTVDGTEPTTASMTLPTDTTLTFKQTTTLKVMGVAGTAQSKVQTYTYTYREPLQRGIRVRFNKPDLWEKVYFYAWQIVGKDSLGNPSSINVMGAYPGQRIYQDKDGWYSYEFAADLDSINFCINSGDDCGGLNVRSNDLVTDYDVCYGWQDSVETMDKYEVELDCEIELHPDFDVVIAPESSFFRDDSVGQVVDIHVVGAEKAMIYYTTDGTEPTTGSLYAQDSVSFTVNQTTTVKAFAVLDKETVTDVQTATFTYKAPQSGPITVRFVQPKDVIDPSTGDTISKAWKDLYIYAFTRVKVGAKFKDTPYALDGVHSKWPGIKWTTTVLDAKGIEWHTWTMKSDIKEIYVIFNIGSNKTQTQDIYLVEDMCYLWNPSCWRAVEDPLCTGILPDGLEAVVVDEVEQTGNKFIYRDQLYIRVGEQVYDIFGRMR